MTDTPAEREAESTWVSLRRRKVVQWGLAYAAGAWVLLQVLGFATDTYGWPTVIAQLAMLGLTLGLPIVVTLAWYHGDRGQQRITGSELAVLTLLLFLSGGVLWLYAQRSAPTTAGTAVKPPPTSAATDAQPSIAVLPFDNRSRLEDDVYFVDGIHDDILTQLSKISALKVISRTSVEQFRDTKLPIKAIASQLGVKSILEGGVQRAGDRVRITVQLIDADTDTHVWAENYDRELSAANIFSIQSELAAAIANALKATLTVSEQGRLAKIPTRDLEAWQDYQLARRRVEQRNSAALVEAEAWFLKAIERDSEFALAYVGLAETLRIQLAFSAVAPTETLARAEQAVQKALALDADLGSAHSASAALAGLRYDFERSESEFKRAIGLDPSYATAHFQYAELLAILGRYTEALREAESAVELDPLSSRPQSYYAQILGHVGRFDEAMARLDRAIEIDPSVALSYWARAQILSYGLNRWTDSLSWLRRSYTLDPGNVLVSTDLALLYTELGDDQRFADWLERARPHLAATPYLARADALFHAYRGEQTQAAAAAERVVALRPRNAIALRLLRDAELRAGRPHRSRERYQSALPELFASPLPPLNRTNYEAAIDLALVLRSIGDDARAAQLLAGSLDYLQGLVRVGVAGYGFADVKILALQGRRAEALNALRQAERAGWRAGWRYARSYDPALDSIRADPAFKAVFADVERDMAQQRARLAARPKDAPLDLAVNQ